MFGNFLKQKKKKKKERYQKKKRKNKRKRIIKNKIIRDIGTFFEQQEEKYYYKPKRVSSFLNNNYIEYESNGDKNSNLSLDQYLNKIKPFLKDIRVDLQSSNTWKIQLTIPINFIFSKNTEEERVIHSTSDNIKFTSYIDVNEVVNELFESLRSKY